MPCKNYQKNLEDAIASGFVYTWEVEYFKYFSSTISNIWRCIKGIWFNGDITQKVGILQLAWIAAVVTVAARALPKKPWNVTKIFSSSLLLVLHPQYLFVGPHLDDSEWSVCGWGRVGFHSQSRFCLSSPSIWCHLPPWWYQMAHAWYQMAQALGDSTIRTEGSNATILCTCLILIVQNDVSCHDG